MRTLTDEHESEATENGAEDSVRTAEDALEERLAEPVLTGMQGIDAAQVWISAFLVVILGAIAFSNVLRVPFHYADQQVIRDNPALHHVTRLPEALQVEGAPPALTMLSLALNWFVAGDNPTLFHVVNIIIHLLNGVLVFLLCRHLLPTKAREPVAMIAGMVFVLHPLVTESVAYAVGRAELLATFCVLVSVLLFLRMARDDSQFRGWAFGASVLAFALGCASGRGALVVPFLILAADWVVSGPSGVRKRLAVHGVFWSVLVAVLVLQCPVISGLHGQGADGARLAGLPADAQGTVFLRGVLLVTSPGAQSVVHDLAVEEPKTMTAVLVAGGIAVAALVLLSLRSMLGFALAWYLAALIPVWLLQTSGPVFTERMLYLPLAGAAFVLPWLFTFELEKKSLRVAGALAATAVILIAGAFTFARNMAWRDEVTLWTDAALKSPQAPLPHHRLGELHRSLGEAAYRQVALHTKNNEPAGAAQQREKAQEYFEIAATELGRAVELEPDNVRALTSLGVVFEYLGHTDEAEGALLRAMAQDPFDSDAVIRMATLLQTKGAKSGNPDDLRRAIGYYNAADGRGHLPDAALVPYGMALMGVGNLEAGARLLERAGAREPDSPLATQFNGVMQALAAARQLQADGAELLRKNPDSNDGLRMTAKGLISQGELLRGVYLLDTALAREPGDLDSWLYLGLAKARAGATADFVRDWAGREPSTGTMESAWMRLVWLCAQSTFWQGAREYLEAEPIRSQSSIPPLLMLGDIARELKQTGLAARYFEEATREYTIDPVPWLRLCDMALESQNDALARQYLAEAERRDANPADLASRQERAGTATEADDEISVLR
jgi:protein O-mannosyl-transferase